jgi:hypothetical protein
MLCIHQQLQNILVVIEGMEKATFLNWDSLRTVPSTLQKGMSCYPL